MFYPCESVAKRIEAWFAKIYLQGYVEITRVVKSDCDYKSLIGPVLKSSQNPFVWFLFLSVCERTVSDPEPSSESLHL